VFHNTGLERLASYKRSSLLGLNVSCEENAVTLLWRCCALLWCNSDATMAPF